MNASTNKTTVARYNADGKLVEVTVFNETTGPQTTRWVYGTTKANSEVASNELLRAKILSDSDDQGNPLADGADGVFDRVEYRYNALGEIVEVKDQNQTVRQFVYDQLGRPYIDKVLQLGAGVDGAVRAITRSYTSRGQIDAMTSYSDAELTTVVNQVLFAYNGFRQILSDAQSHTGAVTGSTPRVSYEYENGTGNTVRQTKLVYPNGREIHSLYATPGTIDWMMDRVHELRDGTTTGTVLARYTKRGTNATVIVEYPEPSVELTYLKQGSEPDGDAGDQYTGLDRFNRIEDIRWLKRAGSTITDVERVQYGFDRASNRTWRKNLVAPPGFDEAYEYDGLYQLSDMRRGDLNINHTTIGAIPVWEESWNYDSAGNWKDYTTRVGGNDPTVQTRTHNKVNEITFIDGSNTKVGYDGAGNMTVMPKVGAPGTAQQNTWDAWNRLVKVMEGATIIGQYGYDGLTRRITKMVSGEVRHGYFTTQWQLVEERTGASETADRQFVWGTRYIDDLILRDCAAFTPTRLYALHDQWHVTGVVDATGVAQERYIYSAFGGSSVLTGSFLSRNISFYGWETRYGAYRYDNETGLYAVRRRYLNPLLGRWISRDPLPFALGSLTYSYIENKSTSGVDVYGLQAKKDTDRSRDCSVEINVGHASGSGQCNEICNNTEWDKLPCGDMIGFVSCGMNNLNDIANKKGHGIPGCPKNNFTKEQFGELSKEEQTEMDGHCAKGGYKRDDFLPAEENKKRVTDMVDAAKKNGCKDKKCCKTIDIQVKCRPGWLRGLKESGHEDDIPEQCAPDWNGKQEPIKCS